MIDLTPTTPSRAWVSVSERERKTTRFPYDAVGNRTLVSRNEGEDALRATFDAADQLNALLKKEGSLLEADRSLGLGARAGVRTGEVEVADGAIRGLNVHIAARIAGLAGADEILTSSTVRDLTAGSGLRFEDRGTHRLRGVAEPRAVLCAMV